MKKLWIFIFGSIMLFNGVFLCFGAAPEAAVTAARQEEVGQLRESLKTIIQDPRFKLQDDLSWLKWAYRKIYGLFQQLTRKPSWQIPIPGAAWWKTLRILGVAVLIALPFIPAFIARYLLQHDKQLKRTPNTGYAPVLNFGELKRTAAALAGEGRYREGIRYLYLAGLERLKAGNLLPRASQLSDKANLKNLRDILGEDHSGYLAFFDLAKIFQEKWYGLKDCNILDYQLAESKIPIIEKTGKKAKS